jgi:predicted O-methyltransferase YrrM
MYEEKIPELMEQFSSFGFTSHQYPNAIGLWPNEQESLLWLALNSPAGNFMEIGSFCGGSAVLLCLVRRMMGVGPTVFSVDRTFSDWGNAFNRNVYRVGKFKDISKQIECDSNELDKYYDNSPLSFVFIDGWHSFSAVLRDFEKVCPWLVPGAIVAFHDTAPQPYKKGQIEHYYRRAVENYKEWTQVELPVWQGSVSVKEYHESEKSQDFLIDEALAYLLKTHNCQLVNIPVIDGSTHFDRVPVYRHGSTSPYHGLAAIQMPS